MRKWKGVQVMGEKVSAGRRLGKGRTGTWADGTSKGNAPSGRRGHTAGPFGGREVLNAEVDDSRCLCAAVDAQTLHAHSPSSVAGSPPLAASNAGCTSARISW